MAAIHKTIVTTIRRPSLLLSPVVRRFGSNAKTIANKTIYSRGNLSRQLGGLEKYFYDWIKIWDDSYGTMVTVDSKLPINADHVSKAVTALVQQLPMLRMSVMDTGNSVKLVESKETSPCVEVVTKEEFHDICKSFTLNSKMWRLVFLNPVVDQTNNLSFVFGIHHSFADFTCVRTVVRDMMRNLFLAQSGLSIPIHNGDTLDRSIEEKTKDSHVSRFDIRVFHLKNNKRPDTANISSAADVFKRSIGEGYDTTISTSSKTLRWKIDRNTSKAFQLSTSVCQNSMISAIIAVFLSSFMNLIKNSLHTDEVVYLPFSFMVDLRKYITGDKGLYGNACIDVFGDVQMSSSVESKHDVWDLASKIANQSREAVRLGEPLRRIREDITNIDFSSIEDKEVIGLSHVGSLDDFLGVNENFQLNQLELNMRPSNNVGPIFDVVTFFLHGELWFNIGYNSSFTPDTFALKMAGQINKIIQNII